MMAKHDPIGSIANKVSPILQALKETYTNINSQGTRISEEAAGELPDDVWEGQLAPVGQYLKDQINEAIHRMTPFAPTGKAVVESAVQKLAPSALGYRPQTTPQEDNSLLGNFGIRRTPKMLTQTPMENKMTELDIKRRSEGGRSKTEADHYTAVSDIEKAIRAGQFPTELVNAALEKGVIVPKDLEKINNEHVPLDPLVSKFKKFSLEDKLRIMEKANPREHALLDEIMFDDWNKLDRENTYKSKMKDLNALMKRAYPTAYVQPVE
jgi:hypothetical protein